MRDLLVYAAARRGACAAVVMPWERRGDFRRIWDHLLTREDAPPARVAWKRVKRRPLAFYLAMLETLSTRRWLRLITLTQGGVPALLRLLRAEGGVVRLRVDDERHLFTIAGVSARLVDRALTPGMQLA